MKAFVLTYEYQYESGYVVGVFSSEAKAIEGKGLVKGYSGGDFHIHEFDMDEWDDRE